MTAHQSRWQSKGHQPQDPHSEREHAVTRARCYTWCTLASLYCKWLCFC